LTRSEARQDLSRQNEPVFAPSFRYGDGRDLRHADGVRAGANATAQRLSATGTEHRLCYLRRESLLRLPPDKRGTKTKSPTGERGSRRLRACHRVRTEPDRMRQGYWPDEPRL